LSDEFDGRVLNPGGVLIDLPFWVFKRLKKLNLLERDPETGRRRIRTDVFGLMDLWEGAEFRHDGPLRGLAPGFERSQSPDSGFSSAFLKALGRDCSGLPHPANDRTKDMESDLDHTRVSDEYRWQKAREVVMAARAKRRAA
jgi:hypothetical protein